MEQPKTTIHAPDNQGTVIGEQTIGTQNNYYGANEDAIKNYFQNILVQEGTSTATLAKLGLSSELANKLIEQSELKDLSPEARHQCLVDSVVNYKTTQKRLDDMMGKSPLIQSLRQNAKTLLEQGDCEQADALIKQASDTISNKNKDAFMLKAELFATRASLALSEWRFEDAVEFYGDAYVFVKDIDSKQARYYLHAQADAFYEYGDKKGNNDFLYQAIKLYKKLLKDYNIQEKYPAYYTMIQNYLGNVFATLGTRESSTDTLQKAVTAYEDALRVYTKEHTPLEWAMTQMNLGNVLTNLGKRESKTETLYKAVTAYKNALLEYTEERVPLDWARTQMNLGTVLRALGTLEIGTETLYKAVTAYKNALKVYTKKHVPLEWAGTQNNLGTVLRELGIRYIERDDFDAENFGGVLRALGTRKSGTQILCESVTAYHNALSEYTQERVPLRWAETQNNLGVVLTELGKRESGTETLQEAVKAYENALKVYTKKHVPLEWAGTQNNLGLCLEALGDKTLDKDYYRQGITTLKDARDVFITEAKQVHHKEWFEEIIARIKKKL